MRLACIDIGSNTTRLLAAERQGRRLLPLREERVFTALGEALARHGHLTPESLDEVSAAVRGQLAAARSLGVARPLLLATAAVRAAPNAGQLMDRIRRETGCEVWVLSAREEARLAFVGAAAALAAEPARVVGVLDVGGGSCELAAGRPPDAVEWVGSLPLGSGTLTAQSLPSDPPGAAELAAAGEAVEQAMHAFAGAPGMEELIAVGGSATSLRRVGGELLTPGVLGALLSMSSRVGAAELATRLGLDPRRARLLPGGLVILSTVAERFGLPLRIGAGGLREGCLLEAPP